jgi:hypothetical protein
MTGVFIQLIAVLTVVLYNMIDVYNENHKKMMHIQESAVKDAVGVFYLLITNTLSRLDKNSWKKKNRISLGKVS